MARSGVPAEPKDRPSSAFRHLRVGHNPETRYRDQSAMWKQSAFSGYGVGGRQRLHADKLSEYTFTVWCLGNADSTTLDLVAVR